MFFRLFCVTFTVLQYAVFALCVKEVQYMNCEDGKTLLTVAINPCHNPPKKENVVCSFRHGNRIKVDAAFVAPFSSSNLETISTASFKGHVIPFPDSGTNPCQGKIVPRCPVEKGNVYLLNYSIDVLKYYPAGPMDIKFSIRDKKTKRALACAKVAIIVERNPELSYA